MSEKTIQLNGVKSTRKQRVGRVTIYLRGKIWYLYYCENGRRVRRRVGVLLADAKTLAAQVNGQLAIGMPDIHMSDAVGKVKLIAAMIQFA